MLEPSTVNLCKFSSFHYYLFSFSSFDSLGLRLPAMDPLTRSFSSGGFSPTFRCFRALIVQFLVLLFLAPLFVTVVFGTLTTLTNYQSGFANVSNKVNEDRALWKLGTLPPGLLTFYNLTHPLNKSWHVLGLGYNPSIHRSKIENTAVIHYNGNMKPWLELAMTKYRPYWTTYINYDHPYIKNCKLRR